MSKNNVEQTHKKKSQLIKDMMAFESDFNEGFDDIFLPFSTLRFLE